MDHRDYGANHRHISGAPHQDCQPWVHHCSQGLHSGHLYWPLSLLHPLRLLTQSDTQDPEEECHQIP